MRLAMRVPGKTSGKSDASATANDTDPREQETAEIIDLASRTAYPAVTQGKRGSDGLGLFAGVAFVALLGGVSFWAMNSARLSEQDSVGNAANNTPAQASNVPASVQPTKAAVVKPSVPGVKKSAVPVNRVNPAPSPIYSRGQAVNVSPVPQANPYASPTVVYDAGAASGVQTGAAVPVVAGALAGNRPAAGGAAVGSAAAFANQIGGVGGASAAAQVMENPATTVTQGTLIPAILETAINTDVPGYVRAVVSQDVRSFDGTKVLVPRSSKLIGQYQSGVQGGQKRAYVIWTRLIRPDGVSVNIASPGVGYDGTTGIAGQVDNHFFKRFGSAMLLSVVGGLGAIASGGASVVLGGAGSSAASVAAQQDSQIGPTIRVRMGEPIRVFTARDLDFSGV
ncbi:MAG: TrbI/VirB10 family protein [Marinomonas sp.]